MPRGQGQGEPPLKDLKTRYLDKSLRHINGLTAMVY